jgi:hypothetical protein
MYVTIANLYMALGQTQLEGAQTSTGGWVFIAVVWTVIAAVWLATSRITGTVRVSPPTD